MTQSPTQLEAQADRETKAANDRQGKAGNRLAEVGDVFFSFNTKDGDAVNVITSMMTRLGARPWSATGQLPADRGGKGLRISTFDNTVGVVLVMGTHSLSTAQAEQDAALIKKAVLDNQCLKRIAVLLPGASADDLPEWCEFESVVRFRPHINGVGAVADLHRAITAEDHDPDLAEFEEQAAGRISRWACDIGVERKLGGIREWLRDLEDHPERVHASIDSSPEETVDDWLTAQTLFTSEVLLGRVNMPQHFGPDSYTYLEQAWLDDTKKLLAYLAWEEQNGWGLERAYRRYTNACKELNDVMFASQIKAGLGDFVQIAEYLGNNFLDRGTLDGGKPAVRDLIAKKAWCIWSCTGKSDQRTKQNWKDAESFVKKFYENIVPAIEENDVERATAVLAALKTGDQEGYRYHIVNCFEASLLTYFMEPATLKKSCDKAGIKPAEIL